MQFYARKKYEVRGARYECNTLYHIHQKMIYHLITPKEWETAKNQPSYAAESLTLEGFIHCSTAVQVARTANNYFKNQPEMLVLHIKEDNLTDAVLKHEANSYDVFPHIYGRIVREAVVSETLIKQNNDNIFEDFLG